MAQRKAFLEPFLSICYELSDGRYRLRFKARQSRRVRACFVSYRLAGGEKVFWPEALEESRAIEFADQLERLECRPRVYRAKFGLDSLRPKLKRIRIS
jgi:hypothetical protein